MKLKFELGFWEPELEAGAASWAPGGLDSCPLESCCKTGLCWLVGWYMNQVSKRALRASDASLHLPLTC